MSPQSLLHTPVDLLRHAPAESQAASHGERFERRAALSVVIGFVCIVAAGAVLGSWKQAQARCAEAATPPAAADCRSH